MDGELMNRPEWVTNLKKYADTNAGRASVQMVNTLLPYIALLVMMYLVLHFELPPLLMVPLILLASGFYIRLFIIFHDCAHGSFVHSKQANRIIGYLMGILTFTSFDEWRKSHLIHHGTVGNIDRKGTGDIWTMTVEEYKGSSTGKRMLYRLYRNPFFLFLLAPFFLFAFVNRVPTPNRSRKENLGILLTDAGILAVLLLVAWTIGIRYYLLIQLPILFVSSGCGLWLFYVQHQFRDVYWSRESGWDLFHAAMEGSSYYRLPAVLQWFTGNIGYHHIHHLNSKIPNYRLKKCQQEVPELAKVPGMSLLSSLKSLRLKLYDEERHVMTGFSRGLSGRSQGNVT
jgi:acyl-lipid omega-6 desaturase (Delta-12 desaturase)